jgi:hypothetical protein
MQHGHIDIMGGRFRVEHMPEEIVILDLRAETRPTVCITAACADGHESCLRALNWLADHGELSVDEYENALQEIPAEE